MHKWLKNLFKIVANYDQDKQRLLEKLETLKAENRALSNLIHDRTTLGVDIQPFSHGTNTIIVMGHYHRVDYIQAYTMRDRDFGEVVSILNDMKRHGSVTCLDAPPSFRAVVERL